MLQAIRKVLFWTYSRGSWQYDILCGLILCFIFLTPASVFDGSAFRSRAGVDQPGKPAHGAPPVQERDADEHVPPQDGRP